jgi:hypothetical protein
MLTVAPERDLARMRERRLVDDQGRLVRWPARMALKREAIRYLAHCFEPGRTYSEADVNAILKARHTFGDHAVLRRMLHDLGYLNRTKDCSSYWVDEVSVIARGL